MKKNGLMKISTILVTALMTVSTIGMTVSADNMKIGEALRGGRTTKSTSKTSRRAKGRSSRFSSEVEESSASIMLQSQNAKPGEIVEVPLIMHTNNQCTAYALLVEYDLRLELVDVDGTKMNTDFEQDGKKFVSLVSYDSKPFADDKATAVIKFRISDDAENDKYSVKLREITTLSSDKGDIENYISHNAYITVTGGAEKQKNNCLELIDVTGIKGESAVVQLIPNTNNICSSYSVLIEYNSRLFLEDKDVVGASYFSIFERDGKSYVSLVGYVTSNYNDGEIMAALNFHLPYNITANDYFDVKFAEVNTFSGIYGDMASEILSPESSYSKRCSAQPFPQLIFLPYPS